MSGQADGARIRKRDFALPQARLQQRLFAAECKLVVLVGSLPPLVPGVMDKYATALWAHEDALHAHALRERMRQMRGVKGAHARMPDELDAVFEAALRAPSVAALLLGIFGVLKADVLRVYRDYLATTHPLGDLPSSVMIDQLLEQEDGQVRRGVDLAGRLGASPTDEAWASYLRSRLVAAGGIDGTLSGPAVGDMDRSEDRAFERPPIPNWGTHPIRYCLGDGGPDEDIFPHALTDDADPRLLRVAMYTWLFHEVDAVEALAGMFHPTRELPFDFHMDLSRHMWDEARHSEGGYRGLQRLGLDPRDSDHGISVNLATAGLSPAELYAVVTHSFEAGSFGVKGKVIERIDAFGDDDLATFLRCDRADETMHVSFGHRWVPVLAEHFGHAQGLPELVRSSRDRFNRNWQAQQTDHGIVRTVPMERRHTLTNLARRYGIQLRATV